MIKTIFFDLGNVVVPFSVERAYTRMVELCGRPRDEVAARIRATGLVRPYEKGEIATEPFARAISAALELDITHQAFCDWWNCVFMPDPLVSEGLMEDLASRYRMLALSNTNPLHYAMLKENYPILRHFHDNVLSYEVGAAKPEAAIYRAAIERAGCRAEECFFTDDLAANVEAAREQGIDAVQFLSATQLEQELVARGLMNGSGTGSHGAGADR